MSVRGALGLPSGSRAAGLVSRVFLSLALDV